MPTEVLEVRLELAASRVAAQRRDLADLRERSRDRRRHAHEVLAAASAVGDRAISARLRAAGHASTAPPVPSYVPDEL